jgi:hypothetical protein
MDRHAYDQWVLGLREKAMPGRKSWPDYEATRAAREIAAEQTKEVLSRLARVVQEEEWQEEETEAEAEAEIELEK